MIYKACPHCLGDLFSEDDAGYPEVVCLQCGYRAALAQPGTWPAALLLPEEAPVRAMAPRAARPVIAWPPLEAGPASRREGKAEWRATA